MAAKFLVFIAAFFILACTQASGQGLQVVNGKIKITIGTTSGSSDSMIFFRDHLVQAHRLYGNFLDIEFVPWGQTQLSNNGEFSCQFGAHDCWANRLQRCALNMLKGKQDAQVQYMTCEYSSPYPSFAQGSYGCAHASGINLIDLDYCVTHPGDDLDSAAQAAAAQPMQELGGRVPYIVFNGVVNQALHDDALVRLTSMICFALAADESTGVTHCDL